MYTQENAIETFNQMSGRSKIAAFTGAKFSFSSEDHSCGFSFKGSKKFTHITITLNSLDLYDVRFTKCGRTSIKAEKNTQ